MQDANRLVRSSFFPLISAILRFPVVRVPRASAAARCLAIGCLALAIATAGQPTVHPAPPAGALEPGEAQPTSRDSIPAGPVGHWPLKGDARDVSGHGLDATNHGADLNAEGTEGTSGGAAGFNGRDAFLQVPARRAPPLDRNDFSIAVWIHTDARLDDVPGDLVSQYDPEQRRGFHLTLKNNAGVTFTQANVRQLQFGIDNNQQPSEWTDCGRPGQAVLAFALAAHQGHLYAGTCEPGKDQAGHVYRYAGPSDWIDCGAPDVCNAVSVLAAFDGQLYAGTAKYRLAGSALPESENTSLGGRIYRYEGGTEWTLCGQLPNTEAVGGLVVYRGRLYASSLYQPAGFYRYEADGQWSDCGTPGGKRVEALGVYNGYLYATSYDAGSVFRYDGQSWTDCGRLGDNTQTYAFAIYQGRLYCGTWPSGRVYRFEDIGQWADVGRLGEELEVMGMLVHNGRLLGGTLPLAEVYAYNGGDRWTRVARLDHTPDVKYRRAWAMAEFQGKLFCSTLPSGRIFAFEAGRSVTWDQELPAGWRHVAAVKGKGELRLYVDGELVAQSPAFDPNAFDLSGDQPLRIGFGANDYFRGRMSDLRLYDRALTEAQVAELARQP